MIRPLLTLLMLSTPALADVTVAFREGAPKDRFTFTNESNCTLGPVRLTLDLSSAVGGLIFDVTADGAGVEVFQPFELVTGAEFVSQEPFVEDGDQELTLSLVSFPAGETVAFTLDIDDTDGGREITVNTAEIKGAEVGVRLEGLNRGGIFGDDATARVTIASC